MAFTAGDPGEKDIDTDVGNALGGGSVSSSNDKDFGSDSGPQSGPNVGGKDFGQNLQDRAQGPAFGGMDMSPGRSRSMFGTTYGTQLAGIDQNRFNQMRGITATNPFGRDNIFSKYLGIDPKNIDYSNNISLSNRLSIANNQFSKFVNPQNRPGMPGYNPNYATAEPGKLRAGVQSKGYMTAYGPVMEQARQQSVPEMIARGIAGLTPIGPFVSLMGTKEYGLPGQPGFDSFDPNNPRVGGGLFGTMFGGVNPSQVKQKAVQGIESLRQSFAPNVPAPASGQVAPLDLMGFEQRFSQTPALSQHPLTGETTATVPGQRVSTVSTTGGIDAATAKKADDILGPTSLSYDFYTDPEVSVAYPQASVGTQQMAGNQQGFFGFGLGPLGDALGRSAAERNLSPDVRDFLNEHGMTIKDLMDKNFSKVPDGARLPSGQIMGPEFRTEQRSSLGGPATANQYADLSGLFSQGMTAVGDIVSIPGGYMDTRTGKQYSGRYNPSSSARTYTGTQRPSGVAPFSGAALRQGLANLWGN